METRNVYAEPVPANEDSENSDEDEFTEEEDLLNLNISEGEARMNYRQSGELVPEDKDSIFWKDHRELYSAEIDKLIKDVHNMHGAKFILRECQEIVLHAIGARQNVFFVVGTGVGKTVAYVYGIDLLRKTTGIHNGVGLVTAPLSVILTQKMSDNPEDVIVLTMSGKLKSSSTNQDGELFGGLEEDVFAGKFKLIIGHPESWATQTGQRILEGLKKRKMAILLAIDEFHKVLPKHWGIMRPEMADSIRRVRAFLVKGCPTICLSATTTKEEVEATSEILGLREPAVLLAACPVQSQFKLVTVQSPSSSIPPDGYTDARGNFKPGFLHLFIRIYGKEFVDKIKQGLWSELRRCYMFFRTDRQLLSVYNYLQEELGVYDFRTAPFVMFTSCTVGQSALVIAARASEVPLILTTQRLEMGWHMPGNDIIIYARPPDTLHSIVQGMGRAGRPLPDSPHCRGKALIYLLWNNYDLNSAKDMDDVVRQMCKEETVCLKVLMANYFVGNLTDCGLSKLPNWCCSVCDKSVN